MEDQSIPDNIKKLVKDLQPGELYFLRLSAVKDSAKLEKSYPIVVKTLLDVVENEGRDNIGKLASAALSTPAHQDIFNQYPDLSNIFRNLKNVPGVKEKSVESNELQPDDPSKTSYKKCPFCAEDIRAEAIVCRYCGRDLPVTLSTSPRIVEKYPSTWKQAEYDSQDTYMNTLQPQSQKWMKRFTLTTLIVGALLFGISASYHGQNMIIPLIFALVAGLVYRATDQYKKWSSTPVIIKVLAYTVMVPGAIVFFMGPFIIAAVIQGERDSR